MTLMLEVECEQCGTGARTVHIKCSRCGASATKTFLPLVAMPAPALRVSYHAVVVEVFEDGMCRVATQVSGPGTGHVLEAMQVGKAEFIPADQVSTSLAAHLEALGGAFDDAASGVDLPDDTTWRDD